MQLLRIPPQKLEASTLFSVVGFRFLGLMVLERVFRVNVGSGDAKIRETGQGCLRV